MDTFRIMEEASKGCDTSRRNPENEIEDIVRKSGPKKTAAKWKIAP